MTIKIEVGDKVRIVRVPKGKSPRWGSVGDVGVVKDIVRRSIKIVGVGDGFEGGWWHTLEDLALFADELEDMPPDTWVTFDFAGLDWTTPANGALMPYHPKKGPQ